MGKNGRHLFTSESVTEGHPDKIADQISDAVLDALLAQDPMSRVACETMVTTGLAFIAGEITTKAYADLPGIVRETIKGVGYTRAKYGFDYETCAVISAIHEQSPDIAMGVDPGGAGDQGLMFGYACNETEELMPLPIMLAHKLTRRLTPGPQGRDPRLPAARTGRARSRSSTTATSRCAWRRSSSPPSTRSLVKIETIREDILEKVIHAVIPSSLLDSKTKYFINPTGRFVVGGPRATAASPAARSSWTPTAAWAATAAAPSRARTRRRWTARPPTWRATSPRTSWPRAWPTASRSRSPTPSAWPSRSRSWSTPIGTGKVEEEKIVGGGPRDLPAHAQGHHRVPEPAPPDLQEDRGLRPLRPQRAGLHLGADRQGRGAARPSTKKSA